MLSSWSANGVSSVRQSHLKNLRSKNYQGSDQEFEQILATVLGQCSSAIHPETGRKPGVEVGVSIRGSGDENNKELVITVRKRIDSITVGLYIAGARASHASY